MIRWNFEPGGIIPTSALRDMIRNYQANHLDCPVCAELLLLDDTEFLARMEKLMAASEEKRKARYD